MNLLQRSLVGPLAAVALGAGAQEPRNKWTEMVTLSGAKFD